MCFQRISGRFQIKLTAAVFYGVQTNRNQIGSDFCLKVFLSKIKVLLLFESIPFFFRTASLFQFDQPLNVVFSVYELWIESRKVINKDVLKRKKGSYYRICIAIKEIFLWEILQRIATVARSLFMWYQYFLSNSPSFACNSYKYEKYGKAGLISFARKPADCRNSSLYSKNRIVLCTLVYNY